MTTTIQHESLFTTQEINYLRYFTLLPEIEIDIRLLIDLFQIDNEEVVPFFDCIHDLTRSGWLICNKQKYKLNGTKYHVIHQNYPPDCTNCASLINSINNYIKNRTLDIATRENYIPYAEAIINRIEDDAQLLLSLCNNLSVLFIEIEDYNKALMYNMKTITLAEFTLPRNHHLFTAYYKNAIIIYGKLEDDDKQLDYIHKYITILKTKPEANIKELSFYYYNVALMHYNRSEFENARYYIDEAIELNKRILGSHHPEVLKEMKIQKKIHRINAFNEHLTKYLKWYLLFILMTLTCAIFLNLWQ